MENKPTYRKAGIAIGTITILHVMKPATIIELAVVFCIWTIAIVAILTHWSLEKDKEKKSETYNITHPIDHGGNVLGLQPGTDVGAVPGPDGSDCGKIDRA